MLTGTSTASTQSSGQRMTPIAAAMREHDERRRPELRLEQRHRHFRRGRDQQAGGGGRDAGQHAAQRIDVAILRIEHADRDHQRRTARP